MEVPAVNRARLAAMPFAPRCEAVIDWMRARIAAALGIPPASVDIDKRQNEPWALLTILLDPAHRELGLALYAQEAAKFDSIRSAAAYLARELEMPPPPKTPFGELYGGGSWAWGPLERNFAKSLDRPVVFILSATRSGSTLLRIMLAGHPALFVPPELNLLPFTSLRRQREQAEALGYLWIRGGLPSALKELGQLSVPDTLAEIAALEREEVPIPAIFERLQRAASPRILVDKSPFYGFHPEWLGYAERVFSHARYIHLVRHPAAAVESFVRMRFHRLFGRHWLVWDDAPWLYGEKFWTSTNRQILSFLDSVAAERQLQVRFENLVSEPAAATEEICHFLGIAHDPALLTPYSGNRMLRDVAGWRFATGDPNILLRSGIDPALAAPPSVVVWPFGESTRDVAARLQYAI